MEYEAKYNFHFTSTLKKKMPKCNSVKKKCQEIKFHKHENSNRITSLHYTYFIKAAQMTSYFLFKYIL
jgi:hypothetical protein